MGVVSAYLYYDVADILGMNLEIDKASGKVTGAMERDIEMNGVTATLGLKIVSSKVMTKSVMVLAKGTGNLVVFLDVRAASDQKKTRLHLLNLAKTPALERWLEKTNPVDADEDVLLKLGKGVVKSYEQAKEQDKEQDKGWKEIVPA